MRNKEALSTLDKISRFHPCVLFLLGVAKIWSHSALSIKAKREKEDGNEKLLLHCISYRILLL